jgi:hypothetical protein
MLTGWKLGRKGGGIAALNWCTKLGQEIVVQLALVDSNHH